ncbi:MAG: alpha-beta hydrolase superfamily lysophospholipase [Brevundimonas sp.]|jgi:alpha-beta hydrolase superfamily lysophospholipase
MLIPVLLAVLAASAADPQDRPFAVPSDDGHVINGQADLPTSRPSGAVVLVAGTGAFDRDVRFGRSGTDRDAIFADLARRFTRRGLAAVRYDRRGVSHSSMPGPFDPAAVPGFTAENFSRDLEAVYDWTRSDSGLAAGCIVMLVHSEGSVHLAGVAARKNQPEPDLIIGIGALLESKVDVLLWQSTERDAYSLRMMDADGNGITTNAEVRDNWQSTPSAVFGRLDLLLQPDGAWSEEELETLSSNQRAIFAQSREDALSRTDEAPYPSADTPVFASSWWKTWFVDADPVAEAFTDWNTPMILHYGALDSQTRAERQQRAAETAGLETGRFIIHPERGHTLGEDHLFGPMDEAIADEIADQAAAACTQAAAGGVDGADSRTR